MNTNDEKLIKILQTEWQMLESSTLTLLHSVEKCRNIGTKKIYSFEEQESFDSLTSKFNRSSDLFTQKILRTTWMLLHESFIPFIDLMNVCEKQEIICNAGQMIAIRDMRTQISHEYISGTLWELIPEVMEMTGQLMDNINCCRTFLGKRNWIS